jgi:RNA polymerase sigma-70 factor, ECF subfamily
MYTTPVSLLERLRLPAEPKVTEASWARFVELYTPLLFAWACHLNMSEDDAADLVQDVFVVLVRKLPEFAYDRQRSFRGWLRTLLVNQWRDRWRRLASPAPSPLAEDVAAAVADPAQEVEEADFRRYLVGRALQLMQSDFEPATWKACWETAVQGRPAAQVGAELGLSVPAVYAATSRVLRRLRQELRGFMD